MPSSTFPNPPNLYFPSPLLLRFLEGRSSSPAVVSPGCPQGKHASPSGLQSHGLGDVIYLIKNFSFLSVCMVR